MNTRSRSNAAGVTARRPGFCASKSKNLECPEDEYRDFTQIVAFVGTTSFRCTETHIIKPMIPPHGHLLPRTNYLPVTALTNSTGVRRSSSSFLAFLRRDRFAAGLSDRSVIPVRSIAIERRPSSPFRGLPLPNANDPALAQPHPSKRERQ
jgi:hypothetical protein